MRSPGFLHDDSTRGVAPRALRSLFGGGSPGGIGGHEFEAVSGLKRRVRSLERIEQGDVSSPDQIPSTRAPPRVHAQVTAGYRDRSRRDGGPGRCPSVDAEQGFRQAFHVGETGRKAEVRDPQRGTRDRVRQRGSRTCLPCAPPLRGLRRRTPRASRSLAPGTPNASEQGLLAALSVTDSVRPVRTFTRIAAPASTSSTPSSSRQARRAVRIFRGFRLDEYRGFAEGDDTSHQAGASSRTPALSRAARTARAIAGAPGVSP